MSIVSTPKKPTRTPSELGSLCIIRLPEVKHLTGKSRAAIYSGMYRKEFPASISLGARSVGWLKDEVLRWIEDRVTKTRCKDYVPADKMPKSLRERHRNGTAPTRVATPPTRAAADSR